ncbi:MAG: hypothetical protein ACFE9M_07355 [Promethearchaeota archaeon]
MIENIVENKQFSSICRFSENYDYIIDSEGNQVLLDDPRIVHVLPEARNKYGIRLVKNLYERYNRNIRITKETDALTIQFGKKICSGKECLALVAMVGAVLKDINENRTKDEITIYRASIDQHGPCQNGGWPVIWETFSKRLQTKNCIFNILPNYRNKFLGLSQDLLATENMSFLIGNYLIEAKNALYCIAEDPESAIMQFEKLTDIYINRVKDGKVSLKSGLLKWAREIEKIPRKISIEEAPKVLVFGGLNLMFNYYPVEKFFLKKGIIPKVVDYTESILLVFSEPLIRFGFKKGQMSPEEQFNISTIDESILSDKEIKEFKKVKRSKKKIELVESQIKTFRRLMRKAKLLVDPDTEVLTYLIKGHPFASLNTCTETTCIIGRYLDSIENEVYDGLINLGTFNCQPAMNSQAIIRPMANKSNIPYAAVDCEGPWLSSNQLRLLETNAIQAKRLRKKRNEKNKELYKELLFNCNSNLAEDF